MCLVFNHLPFIATLLLHLGFTAKLRIWQVSACKMEPQSVNISTLSFILEFSAKLRIMQVSACKMGPRSGYIFCPKQPPQSFTRRKNLTFTWCLLGVWWGTRGYLEVVWKVSLHVWRLSRGCLRVCSTKPRSTKLFGHTIFWTYILFNIKSFTKKNLRHSPFFFYQNSI